MSDERPLTVVHCTSWIQLQFHASRAFTAQTDMRSRKNTRVCWNKRRA